MERLYLLSQIRKTKKQGPPSLKALTLSDAKAGFRSRIFKNPQN